MKNKKLVSILLAIVLVLSVFSTSAFAAKVDVTTGTTGTITINNAVENDVLAAYKVLDITYDDSNNTVSYAWNSDFATYFTGTTVEAFAALADDSAELKTLIAGLPQYIEDNSIDLVATQTVAADKTAVFADLAMGEYFIRPTSSTSVYQLMLRKLEPVAENGKYVLNDDEINAKHEEVTVDKTADKTSVTKNETVNYKVTVDIPTYKESATDKTFSVTDVFPDGLTLVPGSIKVQVDGVDVDPAAYTLDTGSVDYTFKLSVSNTQYDNYWAVNGGKQLVITYAATLNDDNTTEVNTVETNTVTFDYSFYPYFSNSHHQKTDTVDVTTFAIKIDKFVKDHEDQKLEGAEFDLYRTATQAEIDGGLSTEIPHTSIQGIKLESGVTGADGALLFAKYEANDTNYDYYLVETKAPSGYNILDNAIKVNFADADVAATDGVFTVKVPNSDGIKLPITGGTGTVIFTVVGIVLMAGAVVLLVTSRKKQKAEENK